MNKTNNPHKNIITIFFTIVAILFFTQSYAATRLTFPIFKAWDNSSVLSGGKLYTYSAGTTTPKATYQDSGGTVPHTNPIILSTLGEKEIFLKGSYKMTLTDSDGVVIDGWPIDNINIDAASFSFAENYADLEGVVSEQYGAVVVSYRSTAGDGGGGVFYWNSSDMSSQVSGDTEKGIYVPPADDPTGESGAWVRSYSGRKNVRWFGAVGDGLTDDTSAITGAINSGGSVYIDEGEYVVSGTTLDITSVNVYGDGQEKSILNITPLAGTPHVIIKPSSNKNGGIYTRFQIKGNAGASSSGEYGLQLGSDSDASVYMESVSFKDIMITGTGDSGLYLERSVYGCEFLNIHTIGNYGWGVEIADKASNKANANLFSRNVIRNCTGGIKIGSSYSNTFVSPQIEVLATEWVGSGRAIDISSDGVGTISANTFINPYIEWNETTASELVYVEDAANFVLSGGYVICNKVGADAGDSLTNLINITSTSDHADVRKIRLSVDSSVSVTNGIYSSAQNSIIQNIDITGAGTITNIISDQTENTFVVNRGVVGTTGSWTPSLEFGGATTGITYTDRAGRYLIIGRTIFIEGYIKLSSKGSAAGSATIDGLPKTVTNTLPNGTITVGRGQATTISGYMQGNTKEINLLKSDGSNSNDTDFSNTTQLRFSGEYTF